METGKSAFTVNFNVIRLATGYVAMANIAGLNIRGGRRNTPFEAAQAFFLVLAGGSGNSDDAAIAIDFLLSNQNISDLEAIPALEDGKTK